MICVYSHDAKENSLTQFYLRWASQLQDRLLRAHEVVTFTPEPGSPITLKHLTEARCNVLLYVVSRPEVGPYDRDSTLIDAFIYQGELRF